jgi:hypothetical protein
LAKDGVAALEKAVQLEPTNRNARAALFKWYFEVPGMGGGGLDKAMAFAEQTVAIYPAVGHFWEALVHFKRKDPGMVQKECRLAIAHYRRYVQLGTQHGAKAVVSKAKERLKGLGIKE